jgi:hypothetical protein
MSWNTEKPKACAGIGACATATSKSMSEATARRI